MYCVVPCREKKIVCSVYHDICIDQWRPVADSKGAVVAAAPFPPIGSYFLPESRLFRVKGIFRCAIRHLRLIFIIY